MKELNRQNSPILIFDMNVVNYTKRDPAYYK